MGDGSRSLSKGHPVVAKKVNQSLDISVREGSIASVSNSFGISYLSPFALLMNATSTQMGILHAVVGLIPGLIQLEAPKLMRKFTRKSIVLTGVLIKSLLWVPIILTGLLYYYGYSHMIWVLILLSGLFYGSIAFYQPSWVSWIGSLVSKNKRGSYFSKRNKMIGLYGMVGMLLAAIILDSFKKLGNTPDSVFLYTLIGFIVIFSISMMTRLYTLKLLSRQYEPSIRIRKKDYFSFGQFIKRSPNNPFGRFTIFKFFTSMAFAIPAPFWALYLLRDLELSYVLFIGMTVTGILFQLMFLPLIGKISDKYGNVRLMKISVGLMFLAPLFYFFSSYIHSPLIKILYLFLLPEIATGFVSAGYTLATNNYVYDAVKREKRGYAVAYMNLVVALGTFTGAGIGSLIAWIGIPFMNTILFIFLFSAVFRLLLSFFGTRHLHEVRKVPEFEVEFLINGIQPIYGVVKGVNHMERLFKKAEKYI